MLAIISLLVVIVLSIIVTRIATIALTHTGLSREVAQFQARSAFTGAGFTTHESERVVRHPLRRRIVLALMLLGNAGIISAVSSLILTFVGQSGSLTLKVVALCAGLVVLWGFATSRWVDRHLSNLIEAFLKRYTRIEVGDVRSLLNLGGDYRLVEMHVTAADWLAGKRLEEAALRDEGVVVLALERQGGAFIGAPAGDTKVAAEDTLIVYGRLAALQALDERLEGRRGDREHSEAVAEQQQVEDEERKAAGEEH